MDKHIVGFTFTDPDSGTSLRMYYAGFSEGLDVAAIPDLALTLPKRDAEKVVNWLGSANIPGVTKIGIEIYDPFKNAPSLQSVASLGELIVPSLPPSINSAIRLRTAFTGAVLNPKSLKRSGFDNNGIDQNGNSCWVKSFDHGKHRLVLSLTPQNILGRLRIDVHIDANNEFWVSGWYFDEKISASSEEQLNSIISSAVTSTFPADAAGDWEHQLKMVDFDISEWPGNSDLSFIMCCYANDYILKDRMIASILATSLSRHLSSITHPLVISDLPHLYSQLKLPTESANSIRRIFELELELTAEGWCNTGAALCDLLRIYPAAFHIFKRSILLKPDLAPPKQGIWIAGRGYIYTSLRSEDFQTVVDIGSEVEKLGDPNQADHGFYTYLGMGYEGLGKIEEARRCYNRALQIEPGCPNSLQGLKRLNENGNLSSDLMLLKFNNEILDVEYSESSNW